MSYRSLLDLRTASLNPLLRDVVDSTHLEIINVKARGAKGIGLRHNDTAAFQETVEEAEEKGGIAYFPPIDSAGPAPKAFYNLRSPVLVKGAVGILANGISSLVKNTNPTDSPASLANCFLFGNGHPALWDDVTSFACDNITQGEDTVVSAAATGISIGTPVWIRSTADHTGAGAYDVPSFVQLNRVTDKVGTTYTMLHPMDEDVTSPLMFPADTSEVKGLLSNNLFVAQDVFLRNVAAESVAGRVFSRGGMLNCDLHFSHIRGANAIFANGMQNSRIRIDHAVVTDKLMDSGWHSANSAFEIGRADYVDVGAGSSAQIRIGENSRNNDVRIGTLNLGELAATNPVVSIGESRQNRLHIGRLTAESLANAAVSFTSSTTSPTQDVCHDNSVEFGIVQGGTGLTRFINYDNTGGENKRNHVRGGRFAGTVSTAAVTLAGEGHVISPECTFEDGGLIINAGVTKCRVHGYFEDWITSTASDSHLTNELKIWSGRQNAAKEHSVYTSAVNNVTTTTPNTIQYTTGTIPADTLPSVSTLFPKIRIRAKGTIVGTNDTKQIAVADDTGAFNTFTIAAGTSGPFELEAEIIVLSNARYDFWGDVDGTRSTTSRTGLDLGANTRKIDLQAWVTNASDTIRFLTASMVIDVGTNPDLES